MNGTEWKDSSGANEDWGLPELQGWKGDRPPEEIAPAEFWGVDVYDVACNQPEAPRQQCLTLFSSQKPAPSASAPRPPVKERFAKLKVELLEPR